MRTRRCGYYPGRTGSTGGWSGGRWRHRFLESEVLEAHLMHARKSVHCTLQRSHGLVKDLVSSLYTGRQATREVKRLAQPKRKHETTAPFTRPK